MCPHCGSHRNVNEEKFATLAFMTGGGIVGSIILGAPVCGVLGILGIGKLTAILGSSGLAAYYMKMNYKVLGHMASQAFFKCPKCGCTDIIGETRIDPCAHITVDELLKIAPNLAKKLGIHSQQHSPKSSNQNREAITRRVIDDKKIHVDVVNRAACGTCVDVCPTSALSMKYSTVSWNKTTCIGCEMCVDSCPIEALKLL